MYLSTYIPNLLISEGIYKENSLERESEWVIMKESEIENSCFLIWRGHRSKSQAVHSNYICFFLLYAPKLKVNLFMTDGFQLWRGDSLQPAATQTAATAATCSSAALCWWRSSFRAHAGPLRITVHWQRDLSDSAASADTVLHAFCVPHTRGGRGAGHRCPRWCWCQQESVCPLQLVS